MILRFPKGYDTPMGEAGGLLSGGQRQRIGLARAMYGDPELVVLDEPNANLDDEGEAALVRAVQGMKAKGKTVVLISHRPGIVGVADRLLILHQGTVQASGPRDGVLAALQQQVVGNQLLAVGMQHRGDATQEGLHLGVRLQGPATGHRHTLGGGTGGNDILGSDPTSGALAQQVEQPGLLLFAP